MQQLFKICFLLYLLFSSAISAFGQGKINKKDQKKIQNSCEVYLQQRINVLTDYDAPTDSLAEVISNPILTLVLLQRSFFQKMEYEGIEFPETNVIRIETEDSAGCIVENDAGQEFKINIQKSADKWIVFGFDNHIVDQADVDSFTKSMEEDLKTELVKDSIKEILKEFVVGWSEFRQTKKSELLKSLTTTEFYDFLVATKEYEDLKGYGDRKVTLKDLERVRIDQDTAWCRVGLKGLGGSQFSLLLQDGVWYVSGADHRICTREDVKDVEENIAKFLEIEKFNARIDRFNENFEPFFKTGDRSILSGIASDQLIDQLEIYRRLAGTMDTSYLRIRGSYVNLSMGTHEIHDDVAYSNTYRDSIRWIKKDEKWLLDELFISPEMENQYDKAYLTFYEFKRRFSVSYASYNAANSIDIPVAVAANNVPDYSKVQNYHRPNRNAPQIRYESGDEQLFKDLQNQIKKVSAETTFKGVIYVEFDVDNLGKAQNFRALDQIGTKEAELAEKIAGQLGNWLPNDDPQSSLTNMVIPIQF